MKYTASDLQKIQQDSINKRMDTYLEPILDKLYSVASNEENSYELNSDEVGLINNDSETYLTTNGFTVNNIQGIITISF